MAESAKKKYEKNYLSQVIYLVNFGDLESIDDMTMKSYKDSLGKEYPELSLVMQQGIVVQAAGGSFSAESHSKPVWQIESADKSHVISVTSSTFGVTFQTYNTFREYIRIIEAAQSAFLKNFPVITQFERLGLRYVNKIKPEQKNIDWSEYINPRLTDSLKFVKFTQLRRYMHNLVIVEDEETQLNINYGIYNQYFPAPIIDQEFILDIDAYTPYSIEIADYARVVEKFNKTIAIYFELSIEQKLREEMGVIDG